MHDDVTAPGVVCPVCGWLGEAAEVCPVCGAQPRQALDIIDELVERVLDEGGSTEHVEADTLRGARSGGVAAFPVAAAPEDRLTTGRETRLRGGAIPSRKAP